MAGVSAAWLARDGFTGAPAITATALEVAHIWADLGDHLLIGDQYIKLYPVCRWAQPAIVAALHLKQQHSFTHDQIETVRIETFHEARCLATRHPQTTEQAQYSLPYPVAAAFVYGTVTAAQVADEALADPLISALCDRIEIAENEDFNAAFPQRRFARAEIRLKNGMTFITEPTEALGDPENPVSDEFIQSKFRELVSPVLGTDGAEEILQLITALPNGGSTDRLFNLLAQKPIDSR